MSVPPNQDSHSGFDIRDDWTEAGPPRPQRSASTTLPRDPEPAIFRTSVPYQGGPHAERIRERAPGRPRTTTSGKRHRQWGRDRRTQPPPLVPQPVSDRRLALGRLAIIVTVSAWIGYFIIWLLQDFFDPLASSAVSRAQAITYLAIVTLLTASALAYLLSRLGFFYRTRKHHPANRAALEQFYDTAAPSLTTIVPSYQEETHVIRKALLSAALQEYPGIRVVLLIDDPVKPGTAHARELLSAARELPLQTEALLAEPGRRFSGALATFEAELRADRRPTMRTMVDLAGHYDAAVVWLENLAVSQEILDHSDLFFANEVILPLAESLRTIALALRDSIAAGAVLGRTPTRRLYRRLAWIFTAEVTSFERKRYCSLSHEANKAMNLNSYIGLMGGSYREVRTASGTALAHSDPARAGLCVPDPEFVVTLDADSVLLPEYCLRLVHLLEQSEHKDMAIAQTPYSAFPGSATRLERIAGATTDIQHIVHQGLTYYDATFWVGANAVIRKRALDDIAETSYIGDWEIRHYIKDRTVIEDTESTIDMGIHGWKLYNVPERMSYSATPPDFGSLCIQRRRWANGGLLILPKLRRQSRARRDRGERSRFGELFLRWNYMASISWSSFSLLVLLAFPFNATLISPLLGLVALPYFMAMASDLKYCGYKRMDVLRIYGFNLILLPVNLAGTISSLVQGITASKAAFARTPKVRDRTVTPPFFVVAPYLLILLAGGTFYFAYRHHLVENMAYAAINVLLAIYATVAFIGLRNSFVDAWVHLTGLLRKPARPRRKKRRTFRRTQVQVSPPLADWRTVLNIDPGDTGQMPAIRASAHPDGRPEPDAADTAPLMPTSGGAMVISGDAAEVVTEEPRSRFSPLRVMIALALVAGAGYGGYAVARSRLHPGPAIRKTWYAPYVDVTLKPTYQFQNTAADPARQSVLGFVVSDPGAPCEPSWGAAYTMRQANQSLTLGSRIAQAQQEGAQVIASFGGQAHTSLAVGCTNVAALTAAYQSVITEYHLSTIDLDIEGAALNSFAAEQRRAAAIAALERSVRAHHHTLSVWLTLPVEPSGLQDNAISVIESMLRDRVAITGINVMTMDFAHAPASRSSLLPQAESALTAVHGQLAKLYPKYGIKLHPSQIWQRLGATVMIGQNNISGERFTIADARGLTSFAAANKLGRISMWSLNRDSQCGSSFAEAVLSNTCSGTAEASLGFSSVFKRMRGQATQPAFGRGGDVTPPRPNTNPADAPYPQWSPSVSYPLGYKVVEHGEIYQAKWFNVSQDPAAQVQFDWQTPWELLGPVLPGDHAPVIPRLPKGTYPTWSKATQYQAGARVLYHGLAYQAKWVNQGVSPGSSATGTSGSPWKPLHAIPGEPTG